MKNVSHDQRIVLTLDAGGSSFRFAALQGGRVLGETMVTPTHGDDLTRSLATIRAGFGAILGRLPVRPVAISFAFPGPACYANGVIGNTANLPGYRGGVPLRAYLENAFEMPVTIRNDADLFTLGESLEGLLPEMNRGFAEHASRRHFSSMLGITLGTGCGGGLVLGGCLFRGDNGQSAEIWQMENHGQEGTPIEETLSIRGIRRLYADNAGISAIEAPMPAEIAALANNGDGRQQVAARMAWDKFGTVLGDVLADAMAMLDVSAVIGGGLSGAYPLFISAALRRIKERGLVQKVIDLEINSERLQLYGDRPDMVRFAHEDEGIPYYSRPTLGIGRTRLGTSEAVWLGAYAVALDQMTYGKLTNATHRDGCDIMQG